MSETALDLNCWEFHIGLLTGVLRAYGAGQETLKSLDWMRDQIVCTPAAPMSPLESLIKEATKPKGQPVDTKTEDGFYSGNPGTAVLPGEGKTTSFGWSDEQEIDLIRLVGEGKKTSDIARHFGKSYGTTSAKIERLRTDGKIAKMETPE